MKYLAKFLLRVRIQGDKFGQVFIRGSEYRVTSLAKFYQGLEYRVTSLVKFNQGVRIQGDKFGQA